MEKHRRARTSVRIVISYSIKGDISRRALCEHFLAPLFRSSFASLRGSLLTREGTEGVVVLERN